MPIFLPIFGSLFHSAIVKSFVRKMEITLVLMSEEIWKTFQDACDGNGNIELNKVSKSVSVWQCHLGLDPNDLDGMSVIAF